MVQTSVIQLVIDEDNHYYEIGDRVRIKMKPRDVNRPEMASEHIGYIDDIKEDSIIVATAVGVRRLYIQHIDKIRIASEDENFDNKWDF